MKQAPITTVLRMSLDCCVHTYFKKFCKFPYGTYSITRQIGSTRVHAPIMDTILGWEPILFINSISAKRSSLYDIGAQSGKNEEKRRYINMLWQLKKN